MVQYDLIIQKLHELEENGKFDKKNQSSKEKEHKESSFSPEKKNQTINKDTLMEDVFNSISDGISVLNKELEIIKVNSYMEQLYQKKLPLIGKKCYQVYQERDTTCPWCPSLKAIETKTTQTTQVPFPNENHPQGWLLLSSFPLIDEQGTITGVIEHVKDISQQKKLESALRQSKEKYERLFHTNPDSIILLDKHGTITDINQSGLKILGLQREEVLNQHFSKINVVRLEDIPRYTKLFFDIIQGKQTEPITYQIINQKTKQPVTLEAYIDIISKEGKISAVQIVSRDLTKKKQSEQRLQESNQRYQHLFDNAADLIVVIDSKGIFLELNKKFEEESGYIKQEMIGKSLITSGIITKKSSDIILTYLPQILKGNQIPMVEIEGVTKQGNIIPFELRAVPLRKDNTIIGAQAILRNISERKNTEQILKQKINELETFQSLAVDREIQMVALKNEVNDLCFKLNLPQRYKTISETNSNEYKKGFLKKETTNPFNPNDDGT